MLHRSRFLNGAQLDSGDERIRAQIARYRLSGSPIEAIIPTSKMHLPSIFDREALNAGRDVAFSQGRNPRAPTLIRHAARFGGITKHLEASNVDVLLIWRGVQGRALLGRRAAEALGIQCLFLENAPVSGWAMADFRGIDAKSSIPKDPSFFAAWREQARIETDWRSLTGTMRASNSDSGRIGQSRRSDWSDDGNFLFIPFQLNRAGAHQHDGGWVADPAKLVEALAEASRALPPGWHLRLKPHPNAAGDLSSLLKTVSRARFVLDSHTNSLDQLAASRGVITVNSAMGLQAFLFGKPTVTLGSSWYGGHGRTVDARSNEELAALLAAPDDLRFDAAIRDDFLAFLFNDYFISKDDLCAGRIDINDLAARELRHRRISERLGRDKKAAT